MTRRFRIVLVAVLLALAAAGGAYAWFWHRIADEIMAGLPPWAGSMAADGIRVSHGPATVSGFPFAFRLDLPAAVFERPSGYPAGRWSGQRLVATARPWRLAEWMLSAPEPSRLDLAAGDERRQATVAAVDGNFLADRRGGALTLTLHRVVGTDPDPLSIAALRIQVAPDAARPNATTVAVAADAIRLPERTQAVLGRDIATLAAHGTLVERVPNLPPAAALEAWRGAGGTIDVERLRLVWGDARIDGAFTLALDAALQPILAGTAQLSGLDAVADALVRAGRISRVEAFGLRGILGAAARPAADGGGRVVPLQFSIQDGRVHGGTVGGTPYRLFAVPRIAWPER